MSYNKRINTCGECKNIFITKGYKPKAYCSEKCRKKAFAKYNKPRSKYPELSLSFENMQILCEDCNMGKSNIWEVDFR